MVRWTIGYCHAAGQRSREPTPFASLGYTLLRCPYSTLFRVFLADVSRQCQIRLGKIIPNTEQRQTSQSGNSVRETITKIQAGRMAPFTISGPGGNGRAKMLVGEWDNGDLCLFQETSQHATGVPPQPGI